MPDERKERLARNEALFRTANERMSDWEERHVDTATELYYCECADLECCEKVPLGKVDYERIRSDARRFFIVPGHVAPDVESVIESHDQWAVVEKNAEVAEVVESMDPGQD